MDRLTLEAGWWLLSSWPRRLRRKTLSHLDTETDLGYIVRAAVQAAPGKKILGVGDMISWSGVLKVWCEHNKVPFGGFDRRNLISLLYHQYS